jgi:hypothetical protein
MRPVVEVAGDHPAWCRRDVCTAHHQPEASLRRTHRGHAARVTSGHGSITVALIQDPDADPAILVTAVGWALGRTAELGTAGVRQLIATLTEQLEVATRDLDPTARP